MSTITWTGWIVILLLYSSKYLTKPPVPEGMWILFCAIIKIFCGKLFHLKCSEQGQVYKYFVQKMQKLSFLYFVKIIFTFFEEKVGCHKPSSVHFHGSHEQVDVYSTQRRKGLAPTRAHRFIFATRDVSSCLLLLPKTSLHHSIPVEVRFCMVAISFKILLPKVVFWGGWTFLSNSLFQSCFR